MDWKDRLPSLRDAVAVGVRGWKFQFPALIYTNGDFRRLGDGGSTRNPRKSAAWYAKRLKLPLEQPKGESDED